MASNNFSNDQKKALLAQKENIIQEIRQYEQRIKEFQNGQSRHNFQDEYSSDSEEDDIILMNLEPNVIELKTEHSKLKTCLQATRELTSLQVLQSEVNIISTGPLLVGEPPVREGGTWKDVSAECRIDLVPFSIMFYAHTSDKKFTPTWYRDLRVVVVKTLHEVELSQSILPSVTRPSEAIMVLNSYAEAYRSRRTTLARLADLYASTLHMEPVAEGGFSLKCANILELSWRLENKWSPLLPFHHLLKFDLEYMEEKYLNIITQSYKKLSDPTISTDERTLLLSKIISICLEAKGPLIESAESDLDTAKVEKRRTDLEQDAPDTKKRKESEVMAPPKALPKKIKPKVGRGKDENRNKSHGNRPSRIDENTNVNQRPVAHDTIQNDNNVTANVNAQTKSSAKDNEISDSSKLGKSNTERIDETANGKANAGNMSKDNATDSARLTKSNNKTESSSKITLGKRTKLADNVKPMEDVANDKTKRPKMDTVVANKENIASNKNKLAENNVDSGGIDKTEDNKNNANKVTNKKGAELNAGNKKTSPKQKETPSNRNKNLENKKITTNLNKQERVNSAVESQKKVTKNRKPPQDIEAPSSSKKANKNSEKETPDTGKVNVAKPKSKTVDKEKNQALKDTAPSERSKDLNTKNTIVGHSKNATSLKNKGNIAAMNTVRSRDNVAITKTKSPKDVDLVKIVNEDKISNLQEYHDAGTSNHKTNIEKLMSSGDRVKKIDDPKFFINKKTSIPLKMKSNRTTKAQSVEKNSKIPQKMRSNISIDSSNKYSSKFSNQSDASVNKKNKNMATNIPRYMKNIAK